MSWQQPPNGNWNANGSTEDSLRAARLNAQRNGALGQPLPLSEQLALQNLGLAGGAATGNPGFQSYAAQGATQPGLFANPQFAQATLGGSLPGQGMHFNNGNPAAYGKLNAFQSPSGMGLNSFPNSQHNTALMALIQQQMHNLQQNSGFQNAGQASHITSNLAQALALAQQQSSTANMRAAAALASNPAALNAYLLRLNQQQALAQNARQLTQFNAAQLLQQQQFLQQQASQLQAAQQQHQMSANMASLLKSGNAGGMGENQLMGGAHANQGMNLAGFSSTGLANSPLASAPLLPILGTDLAKPSSQKGTGPDSLATQVAISGTNSDVMKQMEALSLGPPATRPGSAVSLTDAAGRSQAMSPTGSQQKDGIRGGLSSPPPGGPQLNMGASQGTTATSPVVSKDRDLTTLKTLGQMLAKTGNTVESAVQNGLLGGCNAEDVKIVWEAYVMEVATLKQYDSANKAFQKRGADLVAKRAKSDDPEATKLLMEAAKAPPASVPANLAEALQCLEMDALSGPPNPTLHQPTPNVSTHFKSSTVKKSEILESESAWDGVIENEHDYVPHHIIDEVNTPKDHPTNIELPKEEAFNAVNYGFFAAGGTDDALADCPLEDETEQTTLETTEDMNRDDICRERTKSEENNITAEDDLLEADPQSVQSKNEPKKVDPRDEKITEEPEMESVAEPTTATLP